MAFAALADIPAALEAARYDWAEIGRQFVALVEETVARRRAGKA